jgi:hypothetical protein
MAGDASCETANFPENLREIVRRHRAEAMIETARLISTFQESDDRRREARFQVYQAMYESALGRLTDAERQLILEILRPCCPDVFEAAAGLTPPPPELPALAGSVGTP